MTIDFRKYVDISSSVAGNNSLTTLDLITRIFTTNDLVPTGGVALEFTSAKAVGDYFGTSSEEYLRALFYFTWISKLFTSATKISYSHWADADVAPKIFGAKLAQALAAFQLITNGSFTLTLGGVTHNISSLDFSGDISFAEIAATLQAAIRLQSGAQWTAATVSYAATPGAFNFVGGDNTVAANVNVSAGTTGTDISALIGWLPSALVYPLAPVLSNGVQVETITQTLQNSANLSTNFASYLFTYEAALTQDEVVESATWNLSQNNEYMYLILVTASNAAAYSAALQNIGGTGRTLQALDDNGVAITTEYPEMAPGMILAATNYNLANATQNYMFQRDFDLTPSVKDTATADAYDAIGVNYYGLTQNNGQLVQFYQTGVLSGAGVSTNALDMNTYANEIWFKNAAATELGTLLLSVNKISATQQGRSQVLTTLQSVIDQAVTNGTISVGAELTDAQIADIGRITNDPKAWRQIQTIGYWIGAVVEPYVVNNATQYKIVYTLVYKKNDVIRKIEGRDILI